VEGTETSAWSERARAKKSISEPSSTCPSPESSTDPISSSARWVDEEASAEEERARARAREEEWLCQRTCPPFHSSLNTVSATCPHTRGRRVRSKRGREGEGRGYGGGEMKAVKWRERRGERESRGPESARARERGERVSTRQRE